MANRDQELWLDKLGMSGIRRDILQQKSDETVLYECHNLDVSIVSGEILKFPGQPTSQSIYSWYTDAGFYPPILTTSLHNVSGIDYHCGIGHMLPSLSNGMHFYYQAAGSGNLIDPITLFGCDTWKLISQPVYFMDRMVTPRGDQVPAIISEHVDVTVPLETDLSYDGPAHREAKTGYPFVGFVRDLGATVVWHPPFTSYIGTVSAHSTYMDATGWGLVGTAANTAEPIGDRNVGGPNSPDGLGFLEFDIMPGGGDTVDPDEPWEYGYANYGDDYAVGWGVKYAGSVQNRLYLRKCAVGYVYVYADGTMSEMMVMKWDNDALVPNWNLGGTPKTRVPVNMCVDSSGATGPAAGNTNYCVIAWKFRCCLPKLLFADHTIVGVRVFYSHWSTLEGDTTPYDFESGYKGWNTDYDIFGGMREAMYLDEDDARSGYCRIEGADMSVINEGGTSVETMFFNYILCPCEASVAQIQEVTSGNRNVVINNPMTLGRLWSEIRGEAYSDTGVLVDVGADTSGVTVKLIEDGHTVRSYNYDLSVGEYVSGEVNYITEELPRTAVLSHGCVSQIGRVFHWGVAVPGFGAGTVTASGRKVNWDTLYPTHIDQDGTSWASLLRLDLGVPIRMGDIVSAVSVGRDVLVGTTLGIAVVSFGSGLTNEWSVRSVDANVGVACPGSMAVVGGEVYIVATNGHVYRYRDGSSGLEMLSRQMLDPNSPVLPTYVKTGESYPTDHVYMNVSVASVPGEDRIVICYTYEWTGVLTLVYDIRSGVFTTASRFFIGASSVSGDIPYITTGNGVIPLFDRSADFLEVVPDTSHSTVSSASGTLGASPEIIDDYNVIDTGLYNLAGGAAAWEAKARMLVGFSLERIREALAGLPPGGRLWYHANGWKDVFDYDPNYVAGTHGKMSSATLLYDTGGKFSVTPDLWYVRKITTDFDRVDYGYPWKLSFEKFVASPGRRQILDMLMIKANIGDTFTVKFYPDGSATAHTTLTIAGVVGYKQVRIRVPAKHSIKMVFESTVIDEDAAFSLRRVGLHFREGGKIG